MDPSDGELLAACNRGETWAWEALVERYQRLVYTIPLRHGLAEDDAADVFQTVFALLVQHLPTIREPQGLAKWLITTTKRETWSLIHKRQREPASEDLAGLAQPEQGQVAGDPHEDALWIEQALLRDALGRLGQRCRKLLWLLYYEGEELSYEEIGRRMGMPVGSIGPTRGRCLHKLREILTALGME